MSNTRIVVRIPAEHRAKLERLASDTTKHADGSVRGGLSDVVRDAISAYLARPEISRRLRTRRRRAK